MANFDKVQPLMVEWGLVIDQGGKMKNMGDAKRG